MTRNKSFQTEKIDIFCHTDFLGALKEDHCIGGAKFTTCMKKLKGRNPTGSVILDAGDSFMGTPLSNYFYGKPVVKMMNEIQYDAMTIGNHEFDWGTDNLLNTLSGVNYSVLSANLFYKDRRKMEWAKPYVIIKKKGISIGIIGLTTTETSYTTIPSNVEAYIIKEPTKIVKELIPKIKQEGASIIIVLGHLPIYFDNEEPKGELVDLIDSVDDIDVAIGGHSSTPYAGLRNGTPTVLTAHKGSMIGHIELCFDRRDSKITHQQVRLIDLYKDFDDLKPDQNVQNMIFQYDEELSKKFSQVIGKIEKDLFVKPNQQFELGRWISHSICKSTSTQIGFYNPHGIFGDIYSGEITVGDIYRICPFDSMLVYSKLTGRQILKILNQSAMLENGMLQFSGLRVEMNSLSDRHLIKDVYLPNGVPMKLDKKYTVGTSEFLASGGDKFITFTEVSWEKTQVELRTVLTESVKNEGTIRCE